ncbi:intersectin-1-like [Ruditapes philippinarum]|uniref:intersectin-1-like n=1 Tax=Ruditapes philippinarum TaxID=129788 RepID=UPI00295AC11A|nr:intersectin-1-like [Ruditapes philippinarum]
MDPDADDEQYDSRMPPDAAAPPIENKPSPGPIRRRRKTLHESYDTVQLREIEQTHTPGSPILSTEREQEAHTDPAFHVQSGHDTISVPQQKPEKYIALYDYEPSSDDDMEIKAGQVVTVWEKCGDWFCGEASGRYGYFPGNYVQKAEDTAAPPIAKKPSPDTILRRRSMLDIRTDTIPTHYVHRRDIVQTQLPEASGRRGNIPGNYLRKAAQDINPGADFTNELEKALLRRRAKSEEIVLKEE